MRKVLIGTPCYDGKIDVWNANSLISAIKMSSKFNVELSPVWMSYDALVQRARNDLVSLTLSHGFNDIIFIDSDIEFAPEWLFDLLNAPVDVIGAICPKKSDTPTFNFKSLPTGLNVSEGLLEVEAVGTGLLRISNKALTDVWNMSQPYMNSGKNCRMVFDIQIIDGDLVSEDNVFCSKWRSLGNKVYVNPNMTCSHIGNKKYSHKFNINDFITEKIKP